MPFTLAHAAAALPFRRSSLIVSALIIGTMAPDFEYFLRLRVDDGFGHTLKGAFLLTLPLALFVLWTSHAFVQRLVADLLPDRLERRLTGHLDGFCFWGSWIYLAGNQYPSFMGFIYPPKYMALLSLVLAQPTS